MAKQIAFDEWLKYSDGKLIWKKFRGGRTPGTEAGCLMQAGYIYIRFFKKMYYAHRIVWEMHFGEIPSNMEIDHINGNKSDNRIENLRLASRNQNAKNIGLRIDNTSGIKGVTWQRKTKKWGVRVAKNGKRRSFGEYADIELAELVAIEARDSLHGRFARHS